MAAASRALHLSYSLAPPTDIDPSTVVIDAKPVPTTASVSLPLDTTGSTSTQSPTASYYDSASETVRRAQQHLNETLTAWKDAIGDREKYKEDMGKVAYGKGRATRMTVEAEAAAAAAVADVNDGGDAVDNGEDDEEEAEE
ncbi:hypothetical protein JCM24511_10139 [Saitozyma sp. JCM 24511]|nr:hypothetical protein JCM24511_10139 [Saitozyma sp. JCM 24511]